MPFAERILRGKPYRAKLRRFRRTVRGQTNRAGAGTEFRRIRRGINSN